MQSVNIAAARALDYIAVVPVVSGVSVVRI